MEWLIALVLGLMAGVAGGWSIARAQNRQSLESLRLHMNESTDRSMTVLQTELKDKNEEIQKLRTLYDSEREIRVRAETESKSSLEKAAFTEKSRADITNAFTKISQDVLNETLKIAKGDFSQRREAIDSLLKPLSTELTRLQQFTQNMEKDRHGAYTSLLDQVEKLKLEAGSLSQALRGSKARGRWGELTLRRVVELAGLVEHCDFHEQVHVEDEGRSLIPDMTVHLPDGKTVVVDAKVPIVAYQDAVNAASDEDRQSHLKKHALHVRKHVKDLSGQAYWSQFERSPDFVVMFIPGEAYFAAAVEIESGLIEEAIQSGVLVSSPIMIVALLRTIAMSWRQSQLEENAKRISELGRDLHDRVATFAEHFDKVGVNLGQSVKSYNEAASSLESRVIVQTRKFRELGVTPKKEITELTQIERVPRVLQSDLLASSTDNGS